MTSSTTVSKLLALFLVTLSMAGCQKMKLSEIKSEMAEVIQLSYVPSQTLNSGGLTPVLGLDGDLHMGISLDSDTTPEVWAVVLRCADHGRTFAIKDKDLYSKVKPGDSITLNYRDRIVYDPEVPNSDKVFGYDLISASFQSGQTWTE